MVGLRFRAGSVRHIGIANMSNANSIQLGLVARGYGLVLLVWWTYFTVQVDLVNRNIHHRQKEACFSPYISERY